MTDEEAIALLKAEGIDMTDAISRMREMVKQKRAEMERLTRTITWRLGPARGGTEVPAHLDRVAVILVLPLTRYGALQFTGLFRATRGGGYIETPTRSGVQLWEWGQVAYWLPAAELEPEVTDATR